MMYGWIVKLRKDSNTAYATEAILQLSEEKRKEIEVNPIENSNLLELKCDYEFYDAVATKAWVYSIIPFEDDLRTVTVTTYEDDPSKAIASIKLRCSEFLWENEFVEISPGKKGFTARCSARVLDYMQRLRPILHLESEP